MHAAAGHSSRNKSTIIDFAITRVGKAALRGVPTIHSRNVARISSVSLKRLFRISLWVLATSLVIVITFALNEVVICRKERLCRPYEIAELFQHLSHALMPVIGPTC
jgi:hypothetical protein